MALLLTPGVAMARPVPAAQTCHAGADLGEDYLAIAASPQRWDCQKGSFSLEPEVTFVRFVLKNDGTTPVPRSFVSHYGRFDRITLTAIDADGAFSVARLPDSCSPPD